MQYDFIFAYLRLSRDDKEKMEESNSIKNQRLLIQHFVEKQPEFAGAKVFFFVDDILIRDNHILTRITFNYIHVRFCCSPKSGIKSLLWIISYVR